jgi:hypothetical protein
MDEKMKALLSYRKPEELTSVENVTEAQADEMLGHGRIMDDMAKRGMSIIAQYLETDEKDAIRQTANIFKFGTTVSMSKITTMPFMMIATAIVNEVGTVYAAGFLSGIAFAIDQMKSNVKPIEIAKEDGDK